MLKICSVEGCTRKHNSHGYCSMHGNRLKRYGDINGGIRRRSGDMSSHVKEYYAYQHLKSRCQTKTCKDYKDYGGRGIKVCDRWLGADGFHHFLEDMGPKPSPKHSVDRIDVDGDYCPENCRWATPWTQANNQRARKMSERGVYKDKTSGRYVANIKVGNVRKTKVFRSFDDAMAQRLQWEKDLGILF